MNQEILVKYNELLSKRLDNIPLLDISEDTIRYDFFIALTEVERINSWDIQLESSINQNAFEPRNNKDSNRKEKPQLDLVVNKEKLNISVEFGLFRQNSNKEGTINKTARTVKMMNDMIRLGLDSLFTKRNSYFICVADDKMIGHQLRTKILGKFPSDYLITKSVIQKQKETRTSDFDNRFLDVFFKNNYQIESRIIYNEILSAKQINRETRIIVWKIENKKTSS